MSNQIFASPGVKYGVFPQEEYGFLVNKIIATGTWTKLDFDDILIKTIPDLVHVLGDFTCKTDMRLIIQYQFAIFKAATVLDGLRQSVIQRGIAFNLENQVAVDFEIGSTGFVSPLSGSYTFDFKKDEEFNFWVWHNNSVSPIDLLSSISPGTTRSYVIITRIL